MKIKTNWYSTVLLVLFAFSSAYAGEFAPTSPKELFEWLEGDWRFTLGSRSGTRTYRLITPGHALAWREEFDDSDLIGEGCTAYIESEARFVSLSIHNRAGAIGVMSGTPSPSFDEIVYEPQSVDEETRVEIVWSRNGENAFQFKAYSVLKNERKLLWTANFKRVAE